MIKPILKLLVTLYRFLLSPFISGGSCRYTPTCSSYAQESLEKHNTAKACWLIFKRLGRCHPWGSQGYDPVPHPSSCSSSKSKVLS
ncbi:MAG: membrane protein insertion efficiency factor YidD [bacterium]|nr:membrane protein insertion efficiency factor YidD [bacterium]